jgi:agmatine deiminase
MPAEWAPHEAVWTAWPHDAAEWPHGLDGPRKALMAMVAAIAPTERVELLVRDADDEAAARRLLDNARNVRFRHARYGDVWLRDTGPIFIARPGEVTAARFLFDGWGGKYVMPGDTEVASRVIAWTRVRGAAFDFVLEGGAIDGDGAGTLLTTRQCLLHGARNPTLDREALEARLRWALGAEHVIWLGEGLANDHTDGHVDTLARFVSPGVVACMEPAPGDPNHDALAAVIDDLEASRDASGERLEVVTVPSPGAVEDAAGNLLPASYMNFYIANGCVIVPVYGVETDDAAVTAIEPMFPDRRVIALPAKDVLLGGGAFHCCTQQQPIAEPSP